MKERAAGEVKKRCILKVTGRGEDGVAQEVKERVIGCVTRWREVGRVK